MNVNILNNFHSRTVLKYKDIKKKNNEYSNLSVLEHKEFNCIETNILRHEMAKA